MRISTVRFLNFKGRTGAYSLAPVTLVIGSNFTNKTTIPLAIRLGMAGKLPPPIGTKNIYDLAGDPENPGTMELGLNFDNGREVSWKWSKNANGSVTTDGGLTADVTMPELALDPRLFFGKTQAERVEIIFGACPIDPATFDLQGLKKKFAIIDNPPTEVRETVLLEIFAKMDETNRANVPKWFVTIRDWIKTSASTASSDHKKASGAFAAFRVNEALPTKDVSAEIAQLKAEIAANETGQKVDIEVTKQRIQRLRTQAAGYESPANYDRLISELELPEAMLEEDEIEARKDALEKQSMEALRKSNFAEGAKNNLQRELTAIEKAEFCPTCKAAGKTWRTKAVTDLTLRLAAAKKEAEEAAAAYQSIAASLGEVRALSQNLATRESLLTKKNEVTSLLDEIAKLEETIAEPSPEDLARIAEANEKRANLAELEEKQRQFESYSSDRSRKLELEKSLLAASCREGVFKSAGKILTEAQTAIIDIAFGSVLKVARHFTNGLLNSPIEFVQGELGRRVSQRDVAMGCQAPVGSWIPFSAFSGAEELLALAGFAVALTENAPVKLVILDEMGRLDAARKVDVALRMLTLAENGIIDQAILLDVSPKDYAGITSRPGFEKIQL